MLFYCGLLNMLFWVFPLAYLLSGCMLSVTLCANVQWALGARRVAGGSGCLLFGFGVIAGVHLAFCLSPVWVGLTGAGYICAAPAGLSNGRFRPRTGSVRFIIARAPILA